MASGHGITPGKLPPALLGPVIAALRSAHYAALGFGLAGWAVPSRSVLAAYLVFLPLVALQWLVNRDACVLDNVESWLRHGRFRSAGANPDEGAFIANLIARLSGRRMTPGGIARLVYGLMIVLFLAGAGHLAARSSAGLAL